MGRASCTWLSSISKMCKHLFSARYVIRLDDACPTMRREGWKGIERVLDNYRIRPIVAVVPDNQDRDLMVDVPDPDFWGRVRSWQAKGWSIAMHGHSHRLNETAARQILPIHRKSEFSGLPFFEQAEKLLRAKEIFDAQGVRISAWIAPAHGFDETTLKALRQTTDIEIISDGIAAFPYYDRDFVWVPQQLWRFRAMPFGLWTICLHPNGMDGAALDAFARNVRDYAESFVNFGDIQMTRRRRNIIDRMIHAAFWLRRGRIGAALS